MSENLAAWQWERAVRAANTQKRILTGGLVAPNALVLPALAESQISEAEPGLTNGVGTAAHAFLDALDITEPWQTPTLLNSWAQLGGGNMPVRFRRLPGRIVAVEGFASQAVALSLGLPIFVLPVNYRPEATCRFSCFNAGAACAVSVTSAGVVAMSVTGGGVGDLSLFFSFSVP